LVTPAMFVIVVCATGILLIVILLATSRNKGLAIGSQRTLRPSSGSRAGRSISIGSPAEKIRPTIRQGLDIKAVPKTSPASIRSEAVKPANEKSLIDGKGTPAMSPLRPESAEASAVSAARATATSDPTPLVESTAAPALARTIVAAVPSPLTDDSTTHVCPVLAQDAAEILENRPYIVREACLAEGNAHPDDERSNVLEFAPISMAVDSSLSSGPFLLHALEAAEVVEMRHSLVTVDGASEFMAFHAQEAAESEISHGLLVAESVEEHPAPSLLAFYGLNQQPFDTTPDPAYLYRSRVHREAFTALSQGIENLRGFVALVAEPGMGKTTLLNKLMEDLRHSARVVFLFQTQCNSSELLRYLLTELGVEHDGTDIVAMHRALSQFLYEEMLQGRRFVLIVDEAQNLQDSVLETIRLLSNYETTHAKLIQIVLAGQPQLVDTLMRPGFVQLRQRIAVLANLEPLDAAETAEYIEHRLRAAGSHGAPIFTPEAMALIAERSEGIPRCINNICFNAMLAGYLHRQTIIDSVIVGRVASKLDLELLVRRPQQDPADMAPAATAGSSDPSQLANLLSSALAVKNQPAAAPALATKDESTHGLSLLGKLTEKFASQSWSNKNEFRIQVSLERDYSPGVPIADHYYCRSFYVSEEQAKTLEPGKAVRVKFEQD
jgi:type II secretory pathway predicted ATPase ExeA